MVCFTDRSAEAGHFFLSTERFAIFTTVSFGSDAARRQPARYRTDAESKLRVDLGFSCGECKDINGAYQCMHPARIHDIEVYPSPSPGLLDLGEGGCWVYYTGYPGLRYNYTTG